MILDNQRNTEESTYARLVAKMIYSLAIRNRTYIPRMKEIEEEEREILMYIAEKDYVEKENATLHAWLKASVVQYETEKAIRDEEKEVALQRSFDIRMSMDQILRKSIRNFDADYQQKAVRSLLCVVRSIVYVVYGCIRS